MEKDQLIQALRSVIESMEQGAPAIAFDDRDNLLSTNETEAFLLKKIGIGREHTLRQWRYDGRGPKATKIGGRVYYRLRDLREWLAVDDARMASRVTQNGGRRRASRSAKSGKATRASL